MSTTFLHTGDEHIDAETHGVLNPATGLNNAWESNRAVIDHLVGTAVERGVDFYVSAGDNFRNGRPTPEALLLFVEAHAPLAAAGIPLVLLDGNHHHTGVTTGHRTVVHVVADMLRARGGTVLIADQPALLRLPGGQQVAALPWLSKSRTLHELGKAHLNPVEGDHAVTSHAMRVLHNLAEQADTSAPLIMASHVTVDDFRIDALNTGYSRGSEVELAHLFAEPVLPRAELEQLPFQYGALSHIHTPQQLGERYFYAGSPNRLTFTDLPDRKGGNLVTLHYDNTLNVERIDTPARVMANIDLAEPDVKGQLARVPEHALVRVVLEPGQNEIPRPVRAALIRQNATIAATKTRPAAPPAIQAPTLPEQVDPVTALREWAREYAPKVSPDELVLAAEKLEA